MSLDFEEPTPEPRHVYAAKLTEMKSYPGRWVRLGTYPITQATLSGKIGFRIRRGIFATCQPAGSFEATQRTVDGKIRLYARYMGGERP
ncbi:hypothetical protein ABH931_006096 [Streptacidiphilus sp. MAP12-33]|uniref:hypothetical protein n=1 Tax=Streptacidiphilus sp. MAP12-33 TaxID=3156266 RepID=UPI003516068D